MSAHPRIDRLVVSNFQSLESADIELGPFTVIVGPSNSGKSALLRALRAVIRNVNSPSSVKVGKNAFTSQVTFGGTDVSIERGKSQSTYRVILPDGTEEVFTKAGRTVPDEVQKFLGLPSPDGPDLTFTTQIDPPFLLSETGTVAAKMLGDLTNVSRLHAAAREANRRRLEASKEQKFRQDDAIGCATRFREEFSDLTAQVQAVKDARALMDSVQDKAREAERLSETLRQFEMIEAAEADLHARLKDLPEPADIEALAEQAGALLGERHALLDVITTLARLVEAEDALTTASASIESEISNLEAEYHAVLKDAGTCPTCGSATA